MIINFIKFDIFFKFNKLNKEELAKILPNKEELKKMKKTIYLISNISKQNMKNDSSYIITIYELSK